MPARQHEPKIDAVVLRYDSAATDQITLILFKDWRIRFAPEDDAGTGFCFAFAPA